jgi:hypothetical protein
LGVIASLVFVGFEIRQNTQVARAASVQAISAQITEWQASAHGNPDFMRVLTFLREGGTFADLEPQDRYLYGFVVNGSVRSMENRFRQVQLGIIDDADTKMGGGTSNLYWWRSDHLLDYWRSIDQTQMWPADFVEYMETTVLGIR